MAPPSSKEGVFGSVRELLEDLAGWDMTSVDEGTCTVHATKANGFLGGTSRITIQVHGPDGIPSSETSVISESDGVLSRDKKNVATFVRKLFMRVT